MKFISNAGSDRVLDLIRPGLGRGHKLDMVSDTFSLFAFAELLTELYVLEKARIVVPPPKQSSTPFPYFQTDHLGLLGSACDRASRNKLQVHWLARKLMQWLEAKADV